MFDQQLDIDGNLHDLAPEHETMHLFDSAPQVRGQIALDTDAPPSLRKRTVFQPCERHAAMYATESRYRQAETMVEGGWANSPCPAARCKMRPGTDFYAASFVAANPVYTVGDD